MKPSGNKVSLNLGMRGSMNFDPTFAGRVLVEAAEAQRDAALEEVERLKAHTWERERAALSLEET